MDSEVWQVTPYKVRILVAFERSPALTPEIEKSLCEDLLARTDSVVGAPWDVTVASPPDELRRRMLHSLDEFTVEQATKIEGAFDKIMLLTVKRENGSLVATVREFDVRTQQLGPSIVRAAWHLGKLRDAALDAILFAFSPLANIASVKIEDKSSILNLKAAGLPTRDPALTIIQPGMIFRPYIRMNDLAGRARRVTTVDWTFLVVDKAMPEHLACHIESGMAVPLNVKRRARMEQLALAVHPSSAPTVLTLRSRTEPRIALAGYEVVEVNKETKDATLLARSDWQGQVIIEPTKKPLRTFMVKYGGELLARLPIVPGLDPSLTADVANADYRLQAEGYITGFQEQVVDLFAHRQMLLKGVRARIEEGEVDQAKEMFDELGRLPSGRVFIAKLIEEKKKLETKDAVVQSKIDKLFNETQKLVEKYFDEKAVEELALEMREAKQGTKKAAE